MRRRARRRHEFAAKAAHWQVKLEADSMLPVPFLVMIINLIHRTG